MPQTTGSTWPPPHMKYGLADDHARVYGRIRARCTTPRGSPSAAFVRAINVRGRVPGSLAARNRIRRYPIIAQSDYVAKNVTRITVAPINKRRFVALYRGVTTYVSVSLFFLALRRGDREKRRATGVVIRLIDPGALNRSTVRTDTGIRHPMFSAMTRLVEVAKTTVAIAVGRVNNVFYTIAIVDGWWWCSVIPSITLDPIHVDFQTAFNKVNHKPPPNKLNSFVFFFEIRLKSYISYRTRVSYVV